MNILVIAAHMDDECFMGGTIAKHVSMGNAVHVLFLTDSCSSQYPGNADVLGKKYDECNAASKILGTTFDLLMLLDMKLDTVPHVELNNALCAQINIIKPQIIYTHWRGDLNKDHCIAYESTMVVCRPMSGVKMVLCYEIPGSTEWGEGFWPNYYVDITDTWDKKVKALSCYETEMRDFPHPRSIKNIKDMACKRGTEVFVKKAEAFVLIRRIV